jgi:hypothetical protein
MTDGWGVTVRIKTFGGAESVEIYYARFPTRADAEEAVKRHVNATPDVVVEARGRMFGQQFDEMNVGPGQVVGQRI